jgi:hypothetical protein
VPSYEVVSIVVAAAILLDIPIVFSCFNKVINLGIHQLEYPLLSSLLVTPKLFCGIEHDGSTG